MKIRMILAAVSAAALLPLTAGCGNDGDGTEKPKKSEEPKKTKSPSESDAVTFKVWGEAPSGVDITYGSDTDNRSAKGLPVTKELKFNEDAAFYSVDAQLLGGGDINCSVTVEGKTKKAHASGSYNICSAQLSNTGFGWE